MFIRRDFELRVQPSRKNGTRDGGKEIKYLPGEQERSRNSKAPGAISNAYLPPPPPPPPPISRCIQFYEGNRFALGFAPKKIHRALLYRGREFNEVSCHVAHTNGRRDFSSIFWRWSNSRVNVIYTCLSSLLLFLFLFIPFYISSSYGRKLEGGSIVTERGSLFFFVRRMKIKL